MSKFIDNLPSGLSPFSTLETYTEAYEKAGYKMNIATVVKKF